MVMLSTIANERYPARRSIRPARGLQMVLKTVIPLRKTNFSFAVMYDENTLIGKVIAILITSITRSFFVMTISSGVRLEAKKASAPSIITPPTSSVSTNMTMLTETKVPFSLARPSSSPSTMYLLQNLKYEPFSPNPRRLR